MDVISSPNACSVTTGGNLWRNKHSTKTINHASFGALKASQQKRKTQIEYNLLSFQQSSSNDHYKCIEGRSKCKKYVVKAVPKPSFDLEPHASEPKNILVSVKNFLVAAFWFCYPYSLIGQGLAVISWSFLAVEKLSNISPLFFTGMLQAIIPQLLMSVYMNGVNQLYDLEIDKINKPYLPLASGKLSYTAGVIIVASCLTLSLWIGWNIGSWPLIWNLMLNTFVWSAYSIDVPFFRWKKYPLIAAMCIVVTTAFIFPITLFLHMQTFVFKNPAMFPRSLIVTVVFMSLYSIVISLFKDIPDIEGDKAFGVDSLATRLGQKRVFWICISILEAAYGFAFLAGVTSSNLWTKIITGLGHAILASVLWYQTKFVDLKSKASVISFYMLIWKLMYGAQFLLPLIR